MGAGERELEAVVWCPKGLQVSEWLLAQSSWEHSSVVFLALEYLVVNKANVKTSEVLKKFAGLRLSRIINVWNIKMVHHPFPKACFRSIL